MLQKTLESPLDGKEIKPVNLKGNQLWIVIGRTDAEAPILWPPNGKSQLIGKGPDAGNDWRQQGKGSAKDEMVGESIINSMDMNLSKLQETVKDREPGVMQFMGLQRVVHDLVTEQQQQKVRKRKAIE